MPRKDAEKCGEIRDRVEKWEKYWTINRSLYYEWIDFIMGDQWREDESKLFERYNKIPLSVNKLGVLMNHIVADFIQNTPNLQVSPEENVPVQVVDVRAAIVKDISLNSDAKSVYQQAFGQSVVGGYSAYAVMTRYLNNGSFEKEPYFIAFDDPNQCYWDIAAKSKCKTDGMFCGFKTRMSRAAFRMRWGKEIESQIGASSMTEGSTLAFSDDDSITQVDDFERVGEKTTLYYLSDRSSVTAEEMKGLEKIKIEGVKGKLLRKDGNIVSIVDKRDIIEYHIVHRQVAGDFILEEQDFPSEQLNLVFVDQKSYYTKSGQQITRSFFKDVKDAQKYLNYLATQSAYMMKVSRYDQFIAPRKSIASPDSQAMFKDPSVVQGALIYDETPSGARPEQLRPPELSQSLAAEYQRTLLDIQSGTGMYNTQMGDMGNEIAGTAINARNKRGSKNTFLPFNSVHIAITVGGEIINEMIPKLYDQERDLILNLPQAQNQTVTINKQSDPYGMQVENDMTKGRFKVRLKAGHSYEGVKEEALESLQLVLNADRSGTVFPMIADLYAENLPLDNNIEIRNRLRTLVPADVIEAGKTGKPLPPKQEQPSTEQMMLELKKAEMQQKAQQAQSEYELKIRSIALKEQELKLKSLETHQNMTLDWEKLNAEKEEAAAELQETMLRFQAENQRVGADLQISHAQNLVRLLTHHPKHLDAKKQ